MGHKNSHKYPSVFWPVPWHHGSRCRRRAWCELYCSRTLRVSAGWDQTPWPNYAKTSYSPAPSLPPWNKKTQTLTINENKHFGVTALWNLKLNVLSWPAGVLSEQYSMFCAAILTWFGVICVSVSKVENLLLNLTSQTHKCELQERFHMY